MRLLISAPSYPSPKVQLSAFIAVLAEEMVRQGVNVTVLAPQSLTTCWRRRIPLCPQKYEVEVETKHGVKKMTILRPYSFTFGQGRFKRLSHRVDRLVVNRVANQLKEKPDVVYSHFWWSAENIIDYAVAHGLPSFVATGEHVINIHRCLNQVRIRQIRENTNGVICVSTKSRDESIGCGLTDGNNTIILPNAVNPDVFHPIEKKAVRKQLGFPQDAFIVSYCGRFCTRKGSGRLAAAIEMLNDDRVKSIFIGTASEGEKEDPTCPGILFKGMLKHDEIPRYLNAADVFVLPTLAEGCSNAIVEAMACGVPVISSDLPFNHDICSEDNSILIDPMNIQAIAEAIRRTMEPNVRERLSDGALKTAQSLTISERIRKILMFIEMRLH